MTRTPHLCLLATVTLAAGCVGYQPYRGPELAVVARNVADGVERIRAQELSSLVLVEEVEYADLEAFVRERFEHGSSRDRLRREAVALSRLGLYEEGDDTLREMESALLGYLVGFYDPNRARLGLVKSSLERGRLEAALARELVLAHELTHALQDQRGDLNAMMSDAMTRSADAHLATMAVIEGEAQTIMYGYLLAGSGKSIADVEGRLGEAISAGMDPLAVRAGLNRPDTADSPVEARLLLFPYYAGATFIQEVFRHGSWKMVDGLFADRPVLSTEQVLHPRKYVDVPDYPVELQFPAAASPEAGWILLHDDVVGELTIRTLFERFLSPDQATVAATGWDGDRLQVYRGPGDVLAYLWAVTWDREEDAEQFANMFHQALPARVPGAELIDGGEGEGQSWTRWACPVGGLMVQRSGHDVLIVEGFSMVTTQQLAATAMPFLHTPHPHDPGGPGDDAQSTTVAEQEAVAAIIERRRAARSAGDPRVDGRRLEDPDYGFQISRPSHSRWHFIHARPGSVQRARIQRLDDLDEDVLLANRHFTVEIVSMGLPLSLEQIARQSERQLAFTLHNFKKLAESTISISKRSAIELRYRGRLGDVAMRFRQVILLHAGNQYKLTAASPVGTYEEDYPDFAEIFASFVLR